MGLLQHFYPLPFLCYIRLECWASLPLRKREQTSADSGIDSKGSSRFGMGKTKTKEGFCGGGSWECCSLRRKVLSCQMGKGFALMGKEVGSWGGSVNNELSSSSRRETRPAQEEVGGRL